MVAADLIFTCSGFLGFTNMHIEDKQHHPTWPQKCVHRHISTPHTACQYPDILCSRSNTILITLTHTDRDICGSPYSLVSPILCPYPLGGGGWHILYYHSKSFQYTKKIERTLLVVRYLINLTSTHLVLGAGSRNILPFETRWHLCGCLNKEYREALKSKRVQ
jgi:hypothetical protein